MGGCCRDRCRSPARPGGVETMEDGVARVGVGS